MILIFDDGAYLCRSLLDCTLEIEVWIWTTEEYPYTTVASADGSVVSPISAQNLQKHVSNSLENSRDVSDEHPVPIPRVRNKRLECIGSYSWIGAPLVAFLGGVS